MRLHPMSENTTSISSTCRYRMSIGLGALVNSFILTGILFLPTHISASENKPVNTAVKNILSLDLCTDWMLA
ncbi:MAG: hypothetical protein KAU29_01775, partial [Gammaproteobacteria bacterium]|nr:hypothetical protein [Gammaproteobacteria bacterium]